MGNELSRVILVTAGGAVLAGLTGGLAGLTGGLAGCATVYVAVKAWFLAKNGLAAGAIVGALADLDKYRKEISQLFEHAFTALSGMIKTIFSGIQKAAEFVSDAVNKTLDGLWSLVDKCVNMTEDVFKRASKTGKSEGLDEKTIIKVSDKQKKEVLETVGPIFSAMDTCVDDFEKRVKPVVERYGKSIDPIVDKLRNLVEQSKLKHGLMVNKADE